MKTYINTVCNLIIRKCGVSNLRRFTFMTLLTLMTTLANADFSTGFESSEGYAVDSTFVGVDGWVLYAGSDRGKVWNDVIPGAKVGNQYAKLYGGSFNTTSIAGFNRLLYANERIGNGRANIWSTSASVWMAVGNADAGNNFGGIYFSDSDGKDAVVAGFYGDKFAYFNGASMVSSPYMCSANTWYLFEFTIKCNGTGVADTYDMTVRNSDGSEVFSVTDKYFRASGEVDYIDNIKIFSGRAPANVIGWPDIGTMYYDQIELPDIPPPPSGTVLFLAGTQLDWTYKFDAATNKTLSGWDTWVFQDGMVTQESSAEFLKISASTAAYNVRRQFDFNPENGYSAVFKLAAEVEGQPGYYNNAMVSIGDVQLYWVAPTSPAISDGTLFIKLSSGALPVARLGKTDDGVHIYWIARQGNKLRLWVDDLSDASAVEFYVTDDASKQKFMLSDDNGSSGKSKFKLYWLFCSEAGVITPENGRLSGVDMSLALDETFGEPLVWTPWPLQGKFVLGAWEIFQELCNNADVKSMKQYKDAGFNMCTATDSKALDVGRELGLHMLVEAQWGWQQRTNYFEGWVELAESYPDVGYLVWDEPEENYFELLKARLKILNQRNPSRLAWINMLPESSWGSVYKSRVDKFIAMVRPRVISFDCYPLNLGGDEYVAYYHNMEIFRELAGDYGIPWWAYVQVFGANAIGLRDPNESEIRWQVYSLLTYGAKGVLYFLYSPFSGGSDGMIDQDGNPTEKYYWVQQLNSEINSMADVLVGVQSMSVMHIGREKAYVTMFSPTSLVNQADASNAILGVFIDSKTGKKYIMVTNKDHGSEVALNGTPQVIILTLGDDVKSITRIGTSKADVDWSFDDNQHILRLEIPPATGVLLEVNR